MPKAKPKTKAGKQKKAAKVMREFHAGTLHSGSPTGPVVTNPAQAKAIALSESGQARKPAKAKRKRTSRSH